MDNSYFESAIDDIIQCNGWDDLRIYRDTKISYVIIEASSPVFGVRKLPCQWDFIERLHVSNCLFSFISSTFFEHDPRLNRVLRTNIGNFSLYYAENDGFTVVIRSETPCDDNPDNIVRRVIENITPYFILDELWMKS
jgi:hypothetical protein